MAPDQATGKVASVEHESWSKIFGLQCPVSFLWSRLFLLARVYCWISILTFKGGRERCI